MQKYLESKEKTFETFFDQLDKTGCFIFHGMKNTNLLSKVSERVRDVFATLAAEWESDIRLSGSCPATGYTRSLEDRTRQH